LGKTILNLRTRLGRVVNLTRRPLYSLRKSLRLPLNMRLGSMCLESRDVRRDRIDIGIAEPSSSATTGSIHFSPITS